MGKEMVNRKSLFLSNKHLHPEIGFYSNRMGNKLNGQWENFPPMWTLWWPMLCIIYDVYFITNWIDSGKIFLLCEPYDFITLKLTVGKFSSHVNSMISLHLNRQWENFPPMWTLWWPILSTSYDVYVKTYWIDSGKTFLLCELYDDRYNA